MRVGVRRFTCTSLDASAASANGPFGRRGGHQRRSVPSSHTSVCEKHWYSWASPAISNSSRRSAPPDRLRRDTQSSIRGRRTRGALHHTATTRGARLSCRHGAPPRPMRLVFKSKSEDEGSDPPLDVHARTPQNKLVARGTRVGARIFNACIAQCSHCPAQRVPTEPSGAAGPLEFGRATPICGKRRFSPKEPNLNPIERKVS